MAKYVGEEGLAELWALLKDRKTSVTINKTFNLIAAVAVNSSGSVMRVTPEEDPLSLVNFYPTVEAVPSVYLADGYSEFDFFPALKTDLVQFPTGDWMVRLPRSYCRVYQVNNTTFYYLGDCLFSGACPAPWSGKYIGRYLMGSGYTSVSGAEVYTGFGISIIQSGLTLSKGAGWRLMDMACYSFVEWGLLIEYLDLYGGKIGLGESSTTNVNGVTDNMPYHTGTTVRNLGTLGPVQYRFIERPWGRVPQIIDGIFSRTDGSLYANYGYSNSASSEDIELIDTFSTGNYYFATLRVLTGRWQWLIGLPGSVSSSVDSSIKASFSFNPSSNPSFFKHSQAETNTSHTQGLFALTTEDYYSSTEKTGAGCRLLYDPILGAMG